MSQNDFTIANQGFPAFRADLNTALQALASNNSGTSAPSTTFANMWWYDSTNNIMYIRNEDNDAWIKFAELDQTNDKFILSGTLQLDDGSASAPALTFNSDTNMGIYRGGTDILRFVTAGVDRLQISADGSISTPTSGTSNFRAGVNAGNSIASGGNYNTVVGDEAGTAISTGDNNTFVGYVAGDAVTTGTESVAFGTNALSASVGADKNTALGAYALRNDTEGESSVAVGHQALVAQNFTSATSTYNVAVGANAGASVSTGIANTLIGGVAGDALTDAGFNTAVGQGSLGSDTRGTSSVAMGYNALNAQNFTGATQTFNTAIGFDSGKSLTTGIRNTLLGSNSGSGLNDADYNVAVGQGALYADTLGSRTTALGYGALSAQNFTSATDSYNTAVGFHAGVLVTVGERNVLVGGLSGQKITDADDIIAIGYRAGGGNAGAATTGHDNVCIGTDAGERLTSGFKNTIVGRDAGDSVTTGQYNTFMGTSAGDGTDDGNENVAIGYNSLSANCANANVAIGGSSLFACTGQDNTAVGQLAGYGITSGVNNLCIGAQSGRTGSPGGNITTASNTIALGDENIANAHIQVDWTVASDQRDKTDFTTLDIGLDFVNALKPVTYKWDKRSKYGDKTADDYDLDAQTPDGTHKEDWLDVGFKAQEVEALEKSVGYKVEDKTNLTTSLTEDGKQYGIQYTKFVPILVKALQELSAKNDALEARIKTLKG